MGNSSFRFICSTHLIVGVSWEDKVASLQQEMEKQNCSACVLTALDDIACKNFFLETLPRLKLGQCNAKPMEMLVQ